MSIILYSCFAAVLALFSYVWLKHQKKRSAIDLPHQKPQLLLGNLLNSGVLTGQLTFHEVLRKYQRQFGDKFVFWFGSYPYLTFCSVEHAQTIFADRQVFEQSPLFLPNFDLLCPNGIFSHTGSRWKRHMRVILPVLKKAKLVHHTDVIMRCVDRWIDEQFQDGQTYTNFLTQCRTLTMNIFGWIAFDYDLNQACDQKLKNALGMFNLQAMLIGVIPWMPRWLVRFYLSVNWKYRRARDTISQVTEKIVQQELESSQNGVDERPRNLIASLVSSLNEQANDEQISSGLTRAEMLDEMLVSLLAGYETTATALTWFIFYMSKHPRVQQKLKDELQEHNLLLTGGLIAREMIDQLVYCECVVKEVIFLRY